MFRALWLASVVSNLGTWMQSVGAAWLMTTLTPSPLLVALMQTATSLSVFLVGLPAGAAADLMDRRRLLLITQTWMLLCAGALGGLTLAGLTTPWLLLALTFALGVGASLNSPAWQAIMADIVSRERLPAAIALNSAGANATRAVGPAVGGLVVALLGPAANFLLNAVSFLGTLGVLYRWRRRRAASDLPEERMLGALRTGLRYTRHAPELRGVFARAGLFVLGASSLWALLPVIARQDLGLDASGYGVLVGCVGLGAVAGALFLPRLRSRWRADPIIVVTTVVLVMALLVLAWVPSMPVVSLALALGGVAWMAITSSFTIAAQTSSAGWVRGRVIATYSLVFQGGFALGSAVWGVAAERLGNPQALSLAAMCLMLGLVVTRRWPLRELAELDLRPSMHWPKPRLDRAPGLEEGPVLVLVEFRVPAANVERFIAAMREVERLRRRDGALRWELYCDPANLSRYVETFLVESWADHLRLHARTTRADRAIEKGAIG